MGFHYGCSFNFQQLLKLVYLLLLNLVFMRQHYKLSKYVLIVRVHCEIQTIKTRRIQGRTRKFGSYFGSDFGSRRQED